MCQHFHLNSSTLCHVALCSSTCQFLHRKYNTTPSNFQNKLRLTKNTRVLKKQLKTLNQERLAEECERIEEEMDKGFGCYDSEKVVVDDDYDVGCKTPTRDECRIPAYPLCPPPVRRKRSIVLGKKLEPPKNGYFQPPDLELFFTAAATSRQQESCA